MQISKASLLDLNALHKLEKESFANDAWPLIDLIAVLTFPNVIRIKATENNQMIGFIAGDPRPNDGVGWVATIAVDSGYRLRGVGRALLHACEKEIGTPRMRLTVRTSNQGAITMYEKEGYKTIDVWQNYYNDGESAMLMEKDL